MWYQKYAPQSHDDIIKPENKHIINQMMEWISKVECSDEITKVRGRPKKCEGLCQEKKAGLVLIGPTGVGKSAVLDVFCRMCESNFDVVVFDCAKMSRKNYEAFFKQTMTYKNVTNLQKGKVIRFDDMESLSDGDNLQLADIIKCVKTTKIPFIGTLHSKYANKLNDFKRFVNIINITAPTLDQMSKFVEQVYAKENMLPRQIPFNGTDVRVYLTACEFGWNDVPDVFVVDGNKAIEQLKHRHCVGYSVNNVNIILHENYPYMNPDCGSIRTLALSDVFLDDSIDNPYICYLESYGNYGTLHSCDLTTKLRPASLWTKTSNMHFKKKLLKEKVKDNKLDNTYDALTTYNATRINKCKF